MDNPTIQTGILHFIKGDYTSAADIFNRLVQVEEKRREQQGDNAQNKTLFDLLDRLCQSAERANLFPFLLSSGRRMAKIEPNKPDGYIYQISALKKLGRHLDAVKIHVEGSKLCVRPFDSDLGEDDTENVDQQTLTTTKGKDPCEVFPFEILRMIFGHFDIKRWTRLQLVRKSWYNYLSGDSFLWAESIDFSVFTSPKCNIQNLKICLDKVFLHKSLDSKTPTRTIKYLGLGPFTSIEEERRCLEIIGKRFFAYFGKLKKVSISESLVSCDCFYQLTPVKEFIIVRGIGAYKVVVDNQGYADGYRDGYKVGAAEMVYLQHGYYELNGYRQRRQNNHVEYNQSYLQGYMLGFEDGFNGKPRQTTLIPPVAPTYSKHLLIEKLLETETEIEKLSIDSYHVKTTHRDENYGDKTYPLKYLNLSGIVTYKSLHYLCSVCPQLEEIDLTYRKRQHFSISFLSQAVGRSKIEILRIIIIEAPDDSDLSDIQSSIFTPLESGNIAELPQTLKYLYLNGVEIASMDNVTGSLYKLETLDLSGSNLDLTSFIDKFNIGKSLKKLLLKRFHPVRAGAANHILDFQTILPKCFNLERLSLYSTNEFEIRNLKNCTRLEQVDIGQTGCDDSVVKELVQSGVKQIGCENILLSISCCDLISEKGVEVVFRELDM